MGDGTSDEGVLRKYHLGWPGLLNFDEERFRPTIEEAIRSVADEKEFSEKYLVDISDYAILVRKKEIDDFFGIDYVVNIRKFPSGWAGSEVIGTKFVEAVYNHPKYTIPYAVTIRDKDLIRVWTHANPINFHLSNMEKNVYNWFREKFSKIQ
jgi:hypothetical protein